MPKILVIDDDRSVRHIVNTGLQGHCDFEVIQAADGDTGLRLLEEHSPSVCLLDVFLPEHHGLEVFQKIRAIDSRIPVIFITGDKSSETAIEAMRAGAFDYLPKPLNIPQLRDLAVSAAKARALMDQPVALPVGDDTSLGEQFIGNSKAMLEVFKDIGRVAAQTVTVLVRGESGSGKELVARALVNHSDRRDQPFIAVNCAAIPDQLLESELFGHEKGAFTGAERRRVGRFEQCDGGTIFLDEVGDMSPITQGKVLRLLQDQNFERVGGNELLSTDVRIIAATNRPLETMVASDRFREDLLYRLNSFTINLPPLRERRDDIPALLEYFLRRAKSEMNRPELTGLSPQALKFLVNYDWPGNVRQLQSVVRQSLLNSVGTVILDHDLPEFVRSPEAPSTAQPTTPPVREDPHGETTTHTDDAAAKNLGRPKDFESSLGPAEADDESQTAEFLTATGAPAEGLKGQVAVDPQIDADTATQNHQDDFQFVQFIEKRLEAGSTDLYNEAVAELEKRLFERVLQFTGGNQSKTAEILGITRGKVRDRISQYNIQLDRKVSIADDAN